jgi:phosphonatase-like hydrolase
MGPFQLVVFDLAGTTIDDRDQKVLRCLVETCQEYQLPASEEELNALMGMNKREVFLLLAERLHPGHASLAEQLAEQALNAFVTRMKTAYEEDLVPISGAEETFVFLRARGIKIAIDTGFDAVIGGMIIERLNWLGRLVDCVVTSSDVVRGRPAPFLIFHAMEQLNIHNVRQVMKLGDSPADLEEGYNAGCGEVIGVLSGAHTAETLSRYPHTRLLKSIADLPALFD